MLEGSSNWPSPGSRLADYLKQCAFDAEFLKPVIPGIDNPELARAVHGKAGRVFEFPGIASPCTDRTSRFYAKSGDCITGYGPDPFIPCKRRNLPGEYPSQNATETGGERGDDSLPSSLGGENLKGMFLRIDDIHFPVAVNDQA